MTLNIEQSAKDLDAAIDCILKHPTVTQKKVGVVGFCMGGQLALLAGTTSDHVGAVVDFYGIQPNVKPDFSKLTAPVLGLFGEQDDFVPPEAVYQLETAIQQAGGTMEARIYANAGHAFFNDTRPEAYNADAAEDAWQRTLTFLQQQLTEA
jgi:carboxymethylenebutenolidase